MCGIVGVLGRSDPEVVLRMARRVAHRGPDDDGFFVDRDAGVGLGHRRLAIIDLSPLGHQPMLSASGRYVLVYNGEIYNYPELRRDLEAAGVRFRGHSDTEVLLELFARDGPECLSRLNGIFTVAVWDKTRRELTLARDGMGVKPLYLATTSAGIGFASELKALLELPGLDRTLDPVAPAAYLSYLWSPGKRTMFRSIEKLEPGEWRTYGEPGEELRRGRFYRLPLPQPGPRRSDADLIAGTAATLRTAVERQMLADVEVGAFLSGGLDSSAIVAFARDTQPERPFNCFTIDYVPDPGEDGELVADLPYARRAAEHLGVALHEIRVGAAMADDFEQLVYQLDEPEADPAALNSLYIAKLARENGIKVLLSGTGGDDLFTGYRRHQAARLESLWRRVPGPVRGGLASAAELLPASHNGLRRVRKLMESAAGSSDLRLARLLEWLPVEDGVALLRGDGATPETVRAPLMDCLAETSGRPAVERVLRLDQRFFLTDHNLNYADKTGMAHGVEIRVPFLDPDLVAWAAGLPTEAKMRGGETKWVLRKAMEPILPHEIIYRPKTGFGVPLRAWLRGRLRPMLEELLDPRTIEHRGLFEPAAVARLRRDTAAGRRDGSYTLLALMAIELWCRQFVDGAGDIADFGDSAGPVIGAEALAGTAS